MKTKKQYIFSEQSSLWGEPECIGFGTDEFYFVNVYTQRRNVYKIICVFVKNTVLLQKFRLFNNR